MWMGLTQSVEGQNRTKILPLPVRWNPPADSLWASPAPSSLLGLQPADGGLPDPMSAGANSLWWTNLIFVYLCNLFIEREREREREREIIYLLVLVLWKTVLNQGKTNSSFALKAHVPYLQPQTLAWHRDVGKLQPSDTNPPAAVVWRSHPEMRHRWPDMRYSRGFGVGLLLSEQYVSTSSPPFLSKRVFEFVF